MEAAEASLTGTLRIIAVLVLIWVVLRLLFRRNTGPGGHRRVPDEQRPKGDVRIEQLKEREGKRPGSGGTVSDADFEEVR